MKPAKDKVNMNTPIHLIMIRTWKHQSPSDCLAPPTVAPVELGLSCPPASLCCDQAETGPGPSRRDLYSPGTFCPGSRELPQGTLQHPVARLWGGHGGSQMGVIMCVIHHLAVRVLFTLFERGHFVTCNGLTTEQIACKRQF